MLAYEHGGGTFILALLISNILIVLPLIIMETMIGQKYQACGPKIFAKLKKGSSQIQRLPIIIEQTIWKTKTLQGYKSKGK